MVTEHFIRDKVSYDDISDIAKRVLGKSRLKGYQTSLQSINELTGGIRTGTLTILGGATGMGKSLLSLNMAVDLITTNIPVCYIDLENGAEETLERVIRIKHHLTEQFFNEEENQAELEFYFMRLINFYYFTHESIYKVKGKSLIHKVLRIMERAVEKECKVFFIDPLQAMESDSKDNFNEQGAIVKTMKEFAQKHDVAVILNHHIRKSTQSSGNFLSDLDEGKEVKYRIPTLDDYKGSAKISDFATDCWAIVRKIGNPDKVEKGMTLFRVLKSRRKSLGDVKLWLDIETLKFYESTKAYDDPAYVRGDKQND